MLFKLIALDIDGTLTNSRKTISARTKSKLIAFQKNGGKIVLASGRPTQGVMPYADALRLKELGGYIMPYNGGCITECSTGNILYRNFLPHSYIPQICSMIKDYPVGINTYKDGKILAGQQINKYTELEARINFMELEFDPNFAESITEDVPKCLLHGEPEVISELEVILSERFGNELGIFKSEPFFLEIVPKTVDKVEILHGVCYVKAMPYLVMYDARPFRPRYLILDEKLHPIMSVLRDSFFKRLQWLVCIAATLSVV